MLLLSSCTTAALDLPDSERFPAPQATVVDEKQAASVPATTTGPQVSDKYPGFSQPLRAASVQMSDQDASQMQQQLAGLAQKRSAGNISESEYRARVEELRKLAATHGDNTIKEIQN